MIPFPGESLALFDAVNVGPADWTLGTDIIRRAGSRTITAGDEWRVWVEPETGTYLEAGSPAVVSWVVEVLSGTVTVTASTGIDPDYGEPTAPAPQALGSHSATGPATLVIPTTFTEADVMDAGAGAFMFVMEATAGAAVVQQVKLRVAPPGGFLGGFGDVLPGFNDDPQDADYMYGGPQILGTTEDYASAEPSWDDAHTAFVADVGPESGVMARSVTFVNPGVCQAGQGIGRNPDGYSSYTRLFADLVLVLGVDWTDAYPISGALVEGVDWIVPPNEVRSDTAYHAQQVGSGSTGWLNAQVTVTTSGDMPGDGIAASTAGAFPVSGGFVTVALDHGGSPGTTALDTTGERIAVTISHTVAAGSDGAVWPGWDPGGFGTIDRLDLIDYTFGVGLDPVQSYAIVPPYRVWDPAGTPAPIPLQWNQRVDGLGHEGTPTWRSEQASSAGAQWRPRL